MQRLTSVIHHLYERGVLKTTEPTHDYRTYSYEYMGRLVKQPVTVGTQMKKSDLQRIVKNATEGVLEDMLTVAMLFNVGYGLPFEPERGVVWSRYAMMDAASEFDRECAYALKCADDAPDLSYPDAVIYPCLDVVRKIHDHKNVGTIKKGCSVLPRLKGVRVYLIYRTAPGVTPHLYAGFYHDKENYFLALDKLVQLGAPRYFGELRGKTTMQEYTPFGHNAMYVVAGTVYIPESKRNGDRIGQVFRQFLTDDTPPLTRSHFDIEHDVAAQREAEKTVNSLQRHNERMAAKGTPTSVEDLQKLMKARRQLEQMTERVKTADPDAEFKAYQEARPEARLRFVATELYRWNREGLKTVPMGRQQHLGMSSLGFYSLTHPALEFVGYVADETDVAKTVNMFEKALDAKVSALIIQPGVDATVRFVDVTRIDL
uniref:Uncharacterized protein n=1 Tax=Pseudomonas phage HRDY3 TaxID=3236930 RepID=A0AB39CE59_9VIRU